jgi:hypothetical protein
MLEKANANRADRRHQRKNGKCSQGEKIKVRGKRDDKR